MSFRKHNEGGWSQTLISGTVAVIYFAPVFWMILTAFKTRQDALAIPPKLFFTPTLDNFKSVFIEVSASGEVTSTGAWVYFANSALIAGSSVLLALIIGTLAAYAFSRYPLKGNDTYLFIILATRMLPSHCGDNTDLSVVPYHGAVGHVHRDHFALYQLQSAVFDLDDEKLL